MLEEETRDKYWITKREEPPGSSKDAKEANPLDQLLDAVLGTLEPVQCIVVMLDLLQRTPKHFDGHCTVQIF